MSYINAVSIFMFILILYFLCILSKRLGEVLGMKKYYYLYYIGMVFTLVASVMITLTILNEKLQIVGDVFFALGFNSRSSCLNKILGMVIQRNHQRLGDEKLITGCSCDHGRLC